MLTIYVQEAGNPELQAVFEMYKSLKQKKHRNKQELITFKQLQANLLKTEANMKQYFENLASQAGVEQLEKALNTGIVEMQVFKGVDVDTMTQEYFDTVSDAVLSGKTYPLFDDQTGKLISYAIREGKIQPSNVSINRAKQVGLSSDLLQRLPLFDDAPIDTIIDIRKELDKPLQRFRSSIIKFSRDVETAAWDKEFPQEVDQVFREHVEPAVLDIEEACRSNKPIFSLISNLVDKPVIPVATSALGVLLANASQLPDIVALGLTTAASSAVVMLRTAQEWREEKKKLKGINFTFITVPAKTLVDSNINSFS